jgi:hypothetical protein
MLSNHVLLGGVFGLPPLSAAFIPLFEDAVKIIESQALQLPKSRIPTGRFLAMLLRNKE